MGVPPGILLMPFNVNVAEQDMHALAISYADQLANDAIPIAAGRVVDLASRGYRPKRLAEAILHRLHAADPTKWKVTKTNSVLMSTPGMKGLW